MTRTLSPTLKETFGFAFETPSFIADRISSTSLSETGMGFALSPAKPVIFGVSLRYATSLQSGPSAPRYTPERSFAEKSSSSFDQLHHCFRGHENTGKIVSLAEILNALFQILLRPIFEARISMDDITIFVSWIL